MYIISDDGDWTDLGAGVSYTDVAARVALFCELAGEELVEFSAEHTVCDKLALLADLRGHNSVGNPIE